MYPAENKSLNKKCHPKQKYVIPNLLAFGGFARDLIYQQMLKRVQHDGINKLQHNGINQLLHDKINQLLHDKINQLLHDDITNRSMTGLIKFNMTR